MQNHNHRIYPHLDWRWIDTVLLDMDGTLLDRHFDDYFWHSYVPENYALLHDLELDESRERLRASYDSCEGTLKWADLDYWTEVLGLDIPALKRRIDVLVAIHPHVEEFLRFCREQGKRTCLVTNAHHKTFSIKMAKVGLEHYWDRVVCAEELGVAKEEEAFWPHLQQHLGYDKGRTMLVDDTERVLDVAARHGLAQLIHVARPSSRGGARFSANYPSIEYFKELMPSE